MKKILLTFIGLLTVLLSANAAVEQSYTLTFIHTSNGDGTQLAATTTMDKIFEASSLEYVSGLSGAPTRMYFNSKMGLKFGSGSGAGDVTFELSEAGQVKVTKLILDWSNYNSDDAGVEISLNGTSVGKTATTTNGTLTSGEIELAEPVVAKTIKIASYGSAAKKSRAFVQSITVCYEAEVSGPVAPQYSNVPENVKLTLGDTMEYPAIEPSDLTYTFSAEPAGILTFDDATKTITATGIGTATVKFTTAAMGDYEAGEGSFDVEVVGKTPELSFANQMVYGKVGTGVVWQTVTITEPADTDAKVTYSSSDPEIVSVDAATGRINPSDIKKAGEVVITATLPASGDYAEGSASYTITVIDTTPAVGGEEPFYTLTFLTGGNTNAMTTSTAISNVLDEASKDYVSGISATSTAYNKSDNGLKFGSSKNTGSVTFALSEQGQVKITKLVVEWASFNTTNANQTYNINGTEVGSTGNYNATTLKETTIEVANPEVATSLSISSTARSYVKSITVYYEGTALKSPELTFEKNEYSMMVDEETTVNAATAPEGVEVEYAIEGLNFDEYSIAKEGENLKVAVYKAGYYTLTAKSAATEEYTEGFDIARLNVYAPVAAYADGEEITSDTFNAEGEDAAVTITFDVPANDYIYYKLESTAATTVKAADAESDDENQLPGYTLYKDGIEIPAGFNGTLSYYQANYGFLSPVKTLAISIPTGVAEIAIDEEGAVRYYDLNGREVKGQLENGIYVRLQNGKASKVLVK